MLVAVDVESGEPLWSFDAGSHPRRLTVQFEESGSVIVEQRSCATNRTRLRALDAQTGDEKWSMSVTADGKSDSASPSRMRGNVVVAQTSDSRLAGVDAADGDVRWQIPLRGREFQGGSSSLVVLASDDRAQVEAVGRKDGRSKWSFDLAAGERVVDSGAVGVGKTVVVVRTQSRITQSATSLVALDARAGSELWQAPLPEASSASYPLMTSDVVVISDTSVAPSMSAFDVKTGVLRWTTAIGFSRPEAASESGPILWFGAAGLSGVEAASGAPRWQTPVGPGRTLAAARKAVLQVEAGEIGNTSVSLLDASSGRVQWTKSVTDGLTSGAIGTDAAYLATGCDRAGP